MLPTTMLAMAFAPLERRLGAEHRPLPAVGQADVLLRVLACGVCRTDLHIVDGDLPVHCASVVPGHEIVGEVVAMGSRASRFCLGQRVGVPWLGATCGHCMYCGMARENLCEQPVFTGYDRDGGFAEFASADERFCFALPDRYDSAHAAPLLCAGLIGYRAWSLAGALAPRRLGLYGFGAAAHIVCQLAVAQGQQVFAFTRDGDTSAQAFARSLGAVWAGSSSDKAPELLDAALIFAPAGELVPVALTATRKGATVVCAGIHMSRIPAFDYRLLWGERTLRSVANLTREDGIGFFTLLDKYPVHTHVQTYPLRNANQALDDLRAGAVNGAAVLIP